MSTARTNQLNVFKKFAEAVIREMLNAKTRGQKPEV